MKNATKLKAFALAILLPASAFAGSPAQSGTQETGAILPGTQTGATLPGSLQTGTNVTGTTATGTTETGTTVTNTMQPATNTSAVNTGVQEQVQAEDRSALQQIHIGNIYEIKAALVAFEKRTSPEVRDYAWKTITAHLNNEKALLDFADQYQIDLVNETSAFVANSQQMGQLVESLEQADSALFQDMFIMSLNQSHSQRLAQLQSLANQVSSPEVKAIVQQAINTVQQLQADDTILSPATQPTRQPTL